MLNYYVVDIDMRDFIDGNCDNFENVARSGVSFQVNFCQLKGSSYEKVNSWFSLLRLLRYLKVVVRVDKAVGSLWKVTKLTGNCND